MYNFSLKGARHNPVPREIEVLLDVAMVEPYVEITDKIHAQRLGHFAKELIDKNLLKIYRNPSDKESIVILKVNNFYKPNNVKKIRIGKVPTYVFNDTLIPRIKAP